MAHQWLAREYAAWKGSPGCPTEAEYAAARKRLDGLIGECLRRIAALDLAANQIDAVKKQFDEVQSVLVENGYVCFIRTHTLLDALRPGVPATGGRAVLTERMRKAQKSLSSRATRYRFDCDTGSVIFLSVFEVLKKPVVMVETPGHFFVRWRVGGGRHVNWDVNDGRSYTDQEYRQGKPRTAGGFSWAVERRGRYLQDMTPAEVLAYHQGIEGSLLRRAKRLKEAMAVFQAAIKARPWAGLAKNNLAWMIATSKEFQSPELTRLAVRLAREAVAVTPRDNGYIDTLAAAYAADGQFDLAQRTEMSGNRAANRLRVYADRRKPSETNWRNEPPR